MANDASLVREKLDQAVRILQEKGVDTAAYVETGNVLVTESGAEWLSEPEDALWVI